MGQTAKLRIREFQLSDHDKVLELWKSAGLVFRPGDDLEGVKLKLQRDPDLFLIAEENHEIVAAVMGAWDGRRGWINHLAVRPVGQRKGIGTLLVNELEKRLASKGAEKVNAQIYRSNTQSIDFFKAVGYEIHSDLIMVGKLISKK